jgi:S1-C subfamily serine protease
MTLTSATWGGRPNPITDGDDPPPDGVDPEVELLWVAAVEPGGPAETAGLAVGDRILSLGGVAVDMVGAPVVERMLSPRRIEIGQPIPFVYQRDGRTDTATVIPTAIE